MAHETPQSSTSDDIALCFSGGGYRAAAFHLGALTMLNELGLIDKVKYFSTASGGTIVAMKYVLSRLAGEGFTKFSDDFQKFLLEHNVVKDSFGRLAKKSFNDQRNDMSLVRAAAGIYKEHLTGGLTVQHLMDNALKDGMFKDLVFSSTEFRKGGGFRFRITSEKNRKFGNQNFTIQRDLRGKLQLSDIVAASSCFPGAFEPIYFPQDFDLDAAARKLAGQPFTGEGKAETTLPLMDGGIVDNQGLITLVPKGANTVPFDFVLISDTTQKAKTIYDYQAAERKRGFTFSTVFYFVLALLTVIFITSLILVGYAFCNWRSTPIFETASIEIAALFSMVVSGVVIALLAFGRHKLGLLKVIGAEFPIWSYIKGLTVRDVISLLMTRIRSAQVLLFSVFMKNLRDLNSGSSLTAVGDEGDNLLHGKNVFSQIYDLESDKKYLTFHENDPEIERTDRMDRVAKAAGKVGTSLWLNKDELDVLIECGRLTTCFAMLRIYWSKWQKADADSKEDHHLELSPPKPTDPSSPDHAAYEKVKAKWKELVENKPPPDISAA